MSLQGNSAVTASPVDANPHKSGGVTATSKPYRRASQHRVHH